MTEKTLLYVFTLFIAVVLIAMVIDSYFFYSALTACNQVPSRPALDSSHVKEVMRNLCGFESSFIPEFCADKLGRRTNSIPALLMKR